MTEIQSKIEEIRKISNNRVDHFKYSRKDKIPFKVHSFIEIMNLRMIDFCEAANLLINRNNLIPSLSLIRALFENIAVTYRISSAIDNSLNSNKLSENFDDLILKLLIGTRYDDDFKAINILTNLEKLDKEYNGIKRFYDDLSEFVHPNWDGLGLSYSILNEKDNYTDILKVITTEHKLFKWFESCFLLCMVIYIDCSKNIKKKLSSFSIMCESDINKI